MSSGPRTAPARAHTAAVLVVLFSSALAARQVFRAGTDVVLLNVTVTDGAGRLVGGLARDEFQVFEDGVLQEVSNFSRDSQPIALSLLLDTSMSMDKKLAIAQQAAAGFVDRLGEHDVAEIIEFNSRPEILQTFTNQKPALRRAIARTEARGSTALYQSIYIAIESLTSARAQPPGEWRRQAIVLLSDGEDTSSMVDYEQVLDLSKRSDVAVYAIGLRTKADRPPAGFNEADFVLRTLTFETGGHAYPVTDTGQLPAIYQQIADELANQYTLAYTPRNPKRDGAWRRIVMRTTRPNVTARTKAGYFAPTVPR
jgi:Ca-activated chloride channel family protein